MRIAVASDEPYAVNEVVVKELERCGHTVVRFGSLRGGQEKPWPEVARQAAAAITGGDCDEGVFFCWTGTGMAIAANKVPGIRAALCVDSETARGARIWNHANVLVLSNRLTANDVAKEILTAWLATDAHDSRGDSAVKALKKIEDTYGGSQRRT